MDRAVKKKLKQIASSVSKSWKYQRLCLLIISNRFSLKCQQKCGCHHYFFGIWQKKRNVIESSLVFQTPLQPGIVRSYQGSEKPYLLDSNGYTDSRHSGTRCTETEPEKSGNTGWRMSPSIWSLLVCSYTLEALRRGWNGKRTRRSKTSDRFSNI